MNGRGLDRELASLLEPDGYQRESKIDLLGLHHRTAPKKH